MLKNFNDYFLNESITKRFQFSINKEDLGSFEEELKEKSEELNVETQKNLVKGIKQIKLLFRFKGEENNIEELISWIKSFNSLKEDKDYDKWKDSKSGWQDGMGKPPWLEDSDDDDDDENTNKGGWQDGMGKPPWLDKINKNKK